MKKEELIGTVITNTGLEPSMKITNVLPTDNIAHFRTEYDYVIQVDNKPEKHTVESLGLKGLSKTLEKSSTELALEWFNSKSSLEKTRLCDKYTEITGKVRRYENYSIKEIEEIWLKENVDYQISDTEFVMKNSYKPNQKQFKEFNPELFKAYINKFSGKDKAKAIHILYEQLPESKLKDYLSKWFSL